MSASLYKKSWAARALLGAAIGVLLLAVLGVFVLREAWNVVNRPSPPATINGWSGGIVDRPGTYTTMTGDVFSVGIDASGIVQYELKDATGSSLLKTNEYHASAYQAWDFYMDNSRRLWFYSGDVGVFVWAPKIDAGYEFITLDQKSTLSHQLPKEFYAKLGKVEQRNLSPRE